MEGCVKLLHVTERVYGNISPHTTCILKLPFLTSRAFDLRVQKQLYLRNRTGYLHQIFNEHGKRINNAGFGEVSINFLAYLYRFWRGRSQILMKSTEVQNPRRKYSISCVLCQCACAEIVHASRCSCNAWCSQFSLQHRLAPSFWARLNVVDNRWVPSDASLCVKRRKLTLGKSK